jgi:hypothetical protein
VKALIRTALLMTLGACALHAATACAQATMPQPPGVGPSGEYEPAVGQQGKDVIWVPTPQELVEKMLDIAKVTPQEYLIDLGSGDGRTVITAARRGITALGIEYEPEMVELSKRKAREAGVADRASFMKADLFETDLSKAQVITLFLLPSINEKLRPKLLDLPAGTRVVSNTFGMGEWAPDDSAQVPPPCMNWCTALLWIVPAKVEGSWRLGRETLALTQSFQRVSGTLGGKPLTEGLVRGKELIFTVDGRRYHGTIDGKQIRGHIATPTAAQGEWSATRL